MSVLISIADLLVRLNEVDESREIEAKKSASELGKSALETISAFANEPGMGGGYLLFGATEGSAGHFVATGVKHPKKLEQEISTACASLFNRTIRPRVWIEIVAGVSLVAAHVPEASPAEKPVFVERNGMQHGAYRRVGSTDQRCTEDDLRVLFRAGDIRAYEDTLVTDATEADLSEEVIAIYRRQLLDENPATELRDASGMELVQAVGGARREGGRLVPTVAGVLLFGHRLALRRLFPHLRVDYIRVPGTEWVPDPDQRYESVDVREPLLVAFRRIYTAVIDDLPKSFTLEPGSPERRDRRALPESAVREALVNALTHRDYRAPSTVQVIRYQDRIEVRNPGYSLVEDEQFGAPGSAARNPRIATVFREMKLAENKGTGVAAIRKAMQRANLTPPFFDSDRGKNQFVVKLFLHNLIGEEDTEWLRGLGNQKLSDHQVRALVVAKRTGSVSNANLRDITGLDTLAASVQLRELRDGGLLEPRGKGSATHYVLTAAARAPLVGENAGAGREHARGFDPQTGGFDLQSEGFHPQSEGFDPQSEGFDPQSEGFDPQSKGFDPQGGEVNLGAPSTAGLLRDVAPELVESIRQLGGKPSAAELRRIIVELCRLHWWTSTELAAALGRKGVSHLSARHLSPLLRDGLLQRRYPDIPAHPNQAYRARQGTLNLDDADDRKGN